jgi:hypothetical protein
MVRLAIVKSDKYFKFMNIFYFCGLLRRELPNRAA